MVKELNEQEVLTKIDAKENFVLDVFMDDCSFCVEYAPIFEKASEGKEFYKFNLPSKTGGGSVFKRKYMTANGKEKIAAPATFIFENGEMKARHYGLISKEQLEKMLETKQAPITGPSLTEELVNLFARKGEIITLSEFLPEINNRIKQIQKMLSEGAR